MALDLMTPVVLEHSIHPTIPGWCGLVVHRTSKGKSDIKLKGYKRQSLLDIYSTDIPHTYYHLLTMLKLALVVPFFVQGAVAICGGFNFGIGMFRT